MPLVSYNMKSNSNNILAILHLIQINFIGLSWLKFVNIFQQMKLNQSRPYWLEFMNEQLCLYYQ